ncbi:hypothetical protein Alide_4046 [Alicycliphilus denitrificans BC]|mgnify:CR=1 FL=1|nr:hypothetical protein Alide_4046 [Alicycliphilus denitrificans BC]
MFDEAGFQFRISFLRHQFAQNITPFVADQQIGQGMSLPFMLTSLGRVIESHGMTDFLFGVADQMLVEMTE